MLEKKNLFDLSFQTIQQKLRREGITAKVLKTKPTIYFYINRHDLTDYMISLEQLQVNGNYIYDFLPTHVLDDSTTLEDIAFYVQKDLRMYFIEGLKTDNRLKEAEKENAALKLELQKLRDRIKVVRKIVA